MLRKNLYFTVLPLIAYCIAVFISSSIPSPIQQSESIPYLDKILHTVLYLPLGVLFFRYFKTLRIAAANPLHFAIFLSIIATSLYGASDEIHQYFIPSRVADIGDWVSDTIGGILGTLLYALPALTKQSIKEHDKS